MSRGADPHQYSGDGGRARYFAHFEPNDFNLQTKNYLLAGTLVGWFHPACGSLLIRALVPLTCSSGLVIHHRNNSLLHIFYHP